MKNTLILISFELIGFSVLFFLLPSIVIRHRLGDFNINGPNLHPLSPEKSLRFLLPSKKPYLDSLTLELKNPALKSKSSIIINIYTTDSHLLRSFTFNGINIGDPGPLPIKFPPITPEEGIAQSVTISSPDPTPESIFYYADNNFLPVYTTTYYLPTLRDSFTYSFENQWSRLKARPIGYNLFYFSLIFILNLYLLTKHVPKT